MTSSEGALPDGVSPGVVSDVPAAPDALTEAQRAIDGWKDRPEIMVFLEELRERPHEFDFFATLRRLEALASDRPRFGRSPTPDREVVRFGQEPSLAFAPSPLARVHDPVGRRPPRIMLHCFGLLGPNGPLPSHLTEFVRDRTFNWKDQGFARFLDIFHHRLTLLFYRAWALNQASVNRDRPAENRFAMYVGSLIGIGDESLLQRDAVPDLAKLHYSGRLALHTKNAEGLEKLVADFFGVPCRLVEFVGQWLSVPADAICRLGAGRSTGELGRSVIVGSRLWDVQQRFRLRLGPMSREDYERFLPTGASFPRLVDWVRNYCGFEFTWDAQLVLRREDVPTTRLGAEGRLGWTTWLATRPLAHDPETLVLRGPD
ncbi:MAG: type VI secretion system baseplate subunit TssG [Phycisphaeraceae bacterium]|nr:type VI secretion system baseplate subunit TssG [Phycisphaeraceae bacterium]MCW5754178.1 type VI secretion system baseplate subunit TssG [Phycisphaeraceae bacterium]